MPILRFNSSTGSDTTASGSNGGITANGTSASFSGSVVTLDGSPDLSGFDAAEDVLWLQTSTGRQFFALSSADNGAKTVTTTDAPAGTASGLTWGIGGKRATWDNTSSRRLWSADAKPGWINETETNQTLTAAITVSVNGSSTAPIITRGTSSSLVINQTANDRGFTWPGAASYLQFNDFTLINSNASKGSAIAFYNRGLQLNFFNITVGTSSNPWNVGFQRSGGNDYTRIVRCDIGHCVSHGVWWVATVNDAHIIDSYIHDCGGSGVNTSSGSSGTITGSIIANNTGDGVFASTLGIRIHSNIIYGNGGDGLDFSTASVEHSVVGNIITGNGGYGINGASGQDAWKSLFVQNAFYNNTSGESVNIDHSGKVTLTADPFTDAANEDWSLNSTAGGGAALKTETLTLGSTTVYPFGRWIAPGGGSSGGGMRLAGVGGLASWGF